MRTQQPLRLHLTKFKRGMTERIFFLVLSLNRWRFTEKKLSIVEVNPQTKIHFREMDTFFEV